MTTLLSISVNFLADVSGMEDFPPLGIPNVHGLIPDPKPYLVVKIIEIWVPTTKRGLESDSRKVKLVNPKQREVLQFSTKKRQSNF
jgi:hypothetical protein